MVFGLRGLEGSLKCKQVDNDRFEIILSASSLDTWSCCEFKGYLTYVQGARDPLSPQDKSLPMWFGDIIHNTVPILRYTGSLEIALNYLEEHFDIPSELQTNWYGLDRAREVISRYNKVYIPDSFHTLIETSQTGEKIPHFEIHCELPFIHNNLFTLYLEGYLDNVSYLESKPKRLYNIDLKTSRYAWSEKGRASNWRKAQIISDQFVIYNWFLKELYGSRGYSIGGTLLDHIQTSALEIKEKHLNRTTLIQAILPDTSQVDLLKVRLTRLCEETIIPVFQGTKKPIANKPAACLMYGGCQFLSNVCSLCGGDLDHFVPELLSGKYQMEKVN